MAVCEEEKAEPQVFCLAAQCLDAALDTILIKGPQLQLLAAACLLVSWKVRECRPISALKIVKYTNFSVQLKTLLEWEVYVLAKLNWNIPALVATDFVDHILKNVVKLGTDLVVDSVTRSRITSLTTQSYVHPSLSRQPPSVLAAASVLLSLQPLLSSMPTPAPPLDTSSSLSCPSNNTSSPELSCILTPVSSKKSPFQMTDCPIARVYDDSNFVSSPDLVIPQASDVERLVQRISFVDKDVLLKARDELQSLANTQKLPQSTLTSKLSYGDTSASGGRFSTSSPLPTAARSLFKDLEIKTPTKVLEASISITDS